MSVAIKTITDMCNRYHLCTREGKERTLALISFYAKSELERLCPGTLSPDTLQQLVLDALEAAYHLNCEDEETNLLVEKAYIETYAANATNPEKGAHV